MPETFVKLDKQIKSVAILDNYSNDESFVASNTKQAELLDELNMQKDLYSRSCRTVQNLSEKLNHLYERIFVERSEEIARLSVEIARKVLMQKVKDGDYEIESIIKEILNNAPSNQDLVVHLNPKDLADCRKIQQDTGSDAFAGIKFVADNNIEQAECVLESPKGIIKSLIDENLEQIGKALNKAG